MTKKPRFIVRINHKTGDYEVYDTHTGEALDPKQCAARLNKYASSAITDEIVENLCGSGQ